MTTVEARWNSIEAQIASLRAESLLAFAAFACGRSIRHVLEFCRLQACADPEICRLVVEEAWKVVEGAHLSLHLNDADRRLRVQAQQCEESEHPTAAAAAEGCYACMVLLEILGGNSDSEQVNRIVRFDRDLTDLLVQEATDFVPGEDIEASILQHSLMQSELQIFEAGLQVTFNHGGRIDELRRLAES